MQDFCGFVLIESSGTKDNREVRFCVVKSIHLFGFVKKEKVGKRRIF